MQTLYIHPDNPQARLIGQICDALNQNEIIICPNAGVYHFVFLSTAKQASETINKIQADSDFVLACQSISQMANFAEIDNEQFRQIKANDGKSVVFRLLANKNTPKYLTHLKHKTIDLVMINQPILQAIAEQADQLCIVPVLQDNREQAEQFSYEIQEKFEKFASFIVHDDNTVSELPMMIDLMD